MVFKRTVLAGKDVVEGDALFATLKGEAPAKLIIYLGGAKIVVRPS